jgi:16S rRNA (uracil1498-N3)-methyltransferase
MKRIYLNEISEESFPLPENERHYIQTVLRHSIGDTIEILTPHELCIAEIMTDKKREIIVKIVKKTPISPPKYTFRVFQCLMKREYMDSVIEKYTELGVTEIVPVISQYSMTELKDSALNRYNEIAKRAALQSERERLPAISPAVKLSSIRPIDGDNILFYERGEISAPTLKTTNVQIVIGAEGGFAADEVEYLTGVGFTSCTPIQSVLKAETAAVVFAGVVRMGLSGFKI